MRILDIPNYMGLSAETYCDSSVAYWAYDKDTIYAYVYDVPNKRLLFNRKIEESQNVNFSTFDQKALGQPKWNSNCTAVEFPENYFVKEPIKADIKR